MDAGDETVRADSALPVEDETTRRRVRRRKGILLGLATLLVAWAWTAVLVDPFYRDRLRALFARDASSGSKPPWIDYAVYEAKDPPIGTPLPQTPAGQEIRRTVAASRQGYLLASLGSCDSCTTLSLSRLFAQTKPRGIRLLAIAHSEKERAVQTAAAYRREGMDIPVFHDADRKLTVALNAYYTGRLYYFTKDWRLRWRERDGRIDNYLFRTGRFDRVLENTR